MMRFASVATACVMSACVLPLSEERAPRVADTRERAARHAQLSLAYLQYARADVAYSEALAANTLIPDNVGFVHLMALSESALGRPDAALRRFSQAVTLDEQRDAKLKPALARDARNGLDVQVDVQVRVQMKAQANAEDDDVQGGGNEQSLEMAHATIKDLSERGILWSNYAIALKAAGQVERAACFSARALHGGPPCLN